MAKTVLIMVGVPGSGKSTWVREFIDRDESANDPVRSNIVVCSADDGHMYDDGAGGMVYVFNVTKAPMAHSDCLNKFLKALSDPAVDAVIVDNTNITEWERQNYLQAAINASCPVTFHVWPCETIEQVKLCAGRNSHGVPAGVIADMAIRFEPPWFEVGSNASQFVEIHSIK